LPPIKNGTLAQLVEQRTENPCVPGSIPGGTTFEKRALLAFFCVHTDLHHLCVMSSIDQLQFHDSAEAFGDALKHIFEDHSRLFILCDENTLHACFPVLAPLHPLLAEAEILVIEPGEASKCLEVAQQLFEQLIESNADRQSLLINLGGGVVTDLGGWLASNYKRGINFLNIPTSLLAMVDASIGGKTGIDLGHHKNMIGTFAFAKYTIVYPSFLNSLQESELDSGSAELIKHALLNDRSSYNQLLSQLPLRWPIASDIIRHSCEFKASVVNDDPKENGQRKMLNLGHTFGHAIESWQLAMGTPVAHGMAVAAGLFIELELALQCERNLRSEIESIQQDLLTHYDFDLWTWPAFTSLLPYLNNDKKNDVHGMRCVLWQGFGKVDVNVHTSEVAMTKAYDVALRRMKNSKME
jgi:3-dehydroquinate synthase